jgi:HSP20 family protein
MRNGLMLRSWLDEMPSSFSRDLFDLRRDFDSFFDRVFGGGRERETERTWWPTLESYVKDGDVHVRVDLPGVSPDDVDVTFERNVLTIRGERRAEHGSAENGYREVRYGRFERSLTLPEGIDPESIRASHANGVLELTLPLPESVKPRKVPIRVEAGRTPQVTHETGVKAA